jgi:hypothetical protein
VLVGQRPVGTLPVPTDRGCPSGPLELLDVGGTAEAGLAPDLDGSSAGNRSGAGKRRFDLRQGRGIAFFVSSGWALNC